MIHTVRGVGYVLKPRDRTDPAATAALSGLRGRSLRTQIVAALVVLLTLSFVAVGGVTALAPRTLPDPPARRAAPRRRQSVRGQPRTPQRHRRRQRRPSAPSPGRRPAPWAPGRSTARVTAPRWSATRRTSQLTADRQIVAALAPDAATPRTIAFPTWAITGCWSSPAGRRCPGHRAARASSRRNVTRLLLIEAVVFGGCLWSPASRAS